MIETLMALWNRGVSGRLIVMVITFFCVCISISLLFVTVGSAWGSLFAHGRIGRGETPIAGSALITATAPTSVATSPVEATPIIIITPNPCLASPIRSHTPPVDVTRSRTRSSDPTARASVVPAHRQKTPTPGVTVTPEPSPTLPAVTPTVKVTVTATTLPTVTATAISTATVTATNTPTVGITPTDTPTPVATPPVTPTVIPTSTPTTGIVPTDTTTPNVTPTVTVPASSPTVMTGGTPGISSRIGHGGGPLTPGSPSNGNNNQPDQGNCFSDTLVANGEGAVLSLLQNFFWIILVSSLLGTALFCAQMCRVSRRRAGI